MSVRLAWKARFSAAPDDRGDRNRAMASADRRNV